MSTTPVTRTPALPELHTATATRTTPAPSPRRHPGRPSQVLAALAVIALLTTGGCGHVIDGNAVPANSPDVTNDRGTTKPTTDADASGAADPTWDDTYRPPVDGRGYSKQPLDQPPPVPAMSWPGWADQPGGHCAWLTPQLAHQFGATGAVTTHPKGCTVPLEAPLHAQITFAAVYAVFAAKTQFINAVDIAGLPGRELALAGQGPTECVVQVSTRSTLTLHVLVWDPTTKGGGDRNRRCILARDIADTVARAVVPAAGGTAHPGAPAAPSTAALDGKTACDVVPQTVADAANLGTTTAQAGTSAHGSTCSHTSQHGAATATLTGTSLDELPTIAASDTDPDADAEVGTTPGAVAGLPARYTVDGPRCAVGVQLTDSTALHIAYEFTSTQLPPGWTCKAAEAMAADAVGGLIAQS